MFDIRAIRETPDVFRKAWNRRKAGLGDVVEEILELDKVWRAAATRKQERESERNAASKLIGQAMAKKDVAEAERLKLHVSVLKADLDQAANEEIKVRAELDDILMKLPNLPLDLVPEGTDEHGNVEQHKWEPRQRHPALNLPKDHADLGEALKTPSGFSQMDFEAAARMSGARFVALRGQLARMERALANFMLDIQTTEHGYQETSVPLLVRDDAMRGTGQLPKFGADLFLSGDFGGRSVLFDEVTNDFNEQWLAIGHEFAGPKQLLMKILEDAPTHEQFWLVPTSEVPLTNLVREQILDASQLPLRFTAHTPCFRSEAGSAGRDTKGMIRQHQFYKVELVSIVANEEEGLKELDRMTACAEEVLKRLELPFRRMLLCTGDMGAGARKTFDLEVWLPSQNTYREISSCSYCGDFQARRMDARYRVDAKSKPEFVHTLNGSGLAVGRTLVAVLENYQNADGSITVPKALVPYMGGVTEIK
jgi:seryl-tRNA synthetase